VRAMDNASKSKSVLESLRTVEFRTGLRGYDMDEVDDYLEKVAVESDALLEQNRQLTERLRLAAERIAQLDADRAERPVDVKPQQAAAAAVDAAGTESLARTMEMAQRFVDQTKRESEQEAARLLDDARTKAATMQAEAEGRYHSDLSRLEGLKTKLASDVEAMARQLEGERTRLRTSLGEMIQWIEDNVQPGAAILALRQGATDATVADETEAAPAAE